MMQRRTETSGHRGFTLIELLVTIALTALLMTLAAPSFLQYQRNAEITALSNSLLFTINTVRSAAMRTGQNALVTPHDRSAGWNSGWVGFVDINRDNEYTENAEAIIHKQKAPGNHLKITGNSTIADSALYLKFNGLGYSIGKDAVTPVALDAAVPVALTLTAKRAGGEEKRCIVVARTGRATSYKPGTNRDCDREAGGR